MSVDPTRKEWLWDLFHRRRTFTNGRRGFQSYEEYIDSLNRERREATPCIVSSCLLTEAIWQVTIEHGYEYVITRPLTDRDGKGFDCVDIWPTNTGEVIYSRGTKLLRFPAPGGDIPEFLFELGVDIDEDNHLVITRLSLTSLADLTGFLDQAIVPLVLDPPNQRRLRTRISILQPPGTRLRTRSD